LLTTMQTTKTTRPRTSVPGLLIAVAAMLAVTALPAPASAAKKLDVRVGIGDQNAVMFDDPNFKRAKIKRVRYFVPWNVAKDREARLRARAYVKAARAHKKSVFLHISSDDLRRKKAKLPSKRKYRRHVKRLVRYFRRLGVREFGSRNEANHDSQATWRSPRRAAWEYKVVRGYVRKSCRTCPVVGLDVLDQRGAPRYVARFMRALGKHRRYLNTVGIHNYSDVNRRRTSGLRGIIRAVRRYKPRAKFWLTETGGIVKFSRSWKYDERRAARRIGFLFNTVRRYRRSIKRVYVYNWYGAQDRTARFDAGLVSGHSVPRPGYRMFRKQIRRFKR
jgi:hypothetical protein